MVEIDDVKFYGYDEDFRYADEVLAKMKEKARAMNPQSSRKSRPKVKTKANIKKPKPLPKRFDKSWNFDRPFREEIVKTRQDYEKEIIGYLVRKAKYENMLKDLNPNKTKDLKMIVSINFSLRNIKEDLTRVQEESGIYINELDKGSRIHQFIAYLKDKYKTIVKKVKKFFKRNYEVIIGVCSVVLPVLAGFFCRKMMST